MRINPGESLESWAERVRTYEYGRALMRIAKGDLVDTVMEDMAKAISTKMMHPVVKILTETTNSNYDAEKSRKSYEENYLKKNKPKSDHVADD